jgi:hypothetical protein
MDVEEKKFFYYSCINICVGMFDKFSTQIQFAVEEIIELLHSQWVGSDYAFMVKESYQNFLRLCLLLKLKNVTVMKPSLLALKIMKVLLINQSGFNIPQIQLLFQMFLKKLISEIDPIETPSLQESIHNSITLLL